MVRTMNASSGTDTEDDTEEEMKPAGPRSGGV